MSDGLEASYEDKILTLTPEMALTRVDFPCATCPIVPMLIVACLEMISGVKGVIFSTSSPMFC
jgi:hypothetical protein